jgi:hypothetical protein
MGLKPPDAMVLMAWVGREHHSAVTWYLIYITLFKEHHSAYVTNTLYFVIIIIIMVYVSIID